MKKLFLLSALMLSSVSYGEPSFIIINGERKSARTVKAALVTSWVGCAAIGAVITYYIMKKKRDKEVAKRVLQKLDEERKEAAESKS